ncbi:endonuclease [Nocardioides gansuensis]|uniref:Endonuclease n=1 Tax=Nocardioides gansuensis TaxID=2138300 RepID=A0A2T8F5S2_9ACTN|nr:endonuclease/exonuclease/phosphatase family protein [Nocardioides gansuensis]PVG81052.1 endonuclease [Nocardioides gansuensis]
MRLGTWNLENLFKPGGDGPTGQAEYDVKLAGLAATVTELAPDVLAVQEVGDPEALDDLVERLPGAWVTALADPDRRGIRVGFVSRLALADVAQFADFPTELGGVQVDDAGERIEQMGRPALQARVDAGGTRLDVITTHLKSKLLTYPGGRFGPKDEGERARFAVYALHRRAAEAATVRAGADALLEGDGTSRAVVVAGDLNDEPQAATTQIFLGPGGSEIGTPGHTQPDRGDGHRLFNLAPLIPEEQRYSRVYRGRRELIDHLLVSHALLDDVTDVTTGSGRTPSITDDPRRRRNAPQSDHRPVVMTLDI